MTNVKPRYSKEEASRRGQEIFENQIAAQVAGENPARFVAIDIETGEYEVGDDELEIIDRLRERRPDAQVWTRRVGSRYAHRVGFHTSEWSP